MTAGYSFDQNESKRIIDHFGQKFFDKVLVDVETYSKRWNLKELQLIDYFSINCIFACQSDYYGDSILKIGIPCREVFTEFLALCEYGGRRFCKAYDSDLENGIILMERIQPGIPLREEKSLVKRLSVFSSLLNGLHIEPVNAKVYPTYFEWVSRITDYMSRQWDHKDLFLLMQKAKDVCRSIRAEYSREMLLHGDFHHDNILLDRNHEYKIIDPKGVIGDPVFDIPRFILNEQFNEDPQELQGQQIAEIIGFLENSLNVPGKIIRQLYFVELAMANCWDVEGGMAPNLASVIFAEAIMNA
jgi:streptomycin 6-kinase